MSTSRLTCRSCSSNRIESVLDFGEIPLANALLSVEQLRKPEVTYPLEFVFCRDCTLAQITETVPPECLFREYLYFSAISETVVQNARDITHRMRERLNLGERSQVVEIASNDGYLLQHYVEKGIPVLGIEPAQNVVSVAMQRGIRTLPEFFDEPLAKRLSAEGLLADVIHANNVVAHVANLHGVVEGIGRLLKPDGVAVVENHYVRDLIEHVEFDSIYHEHLCYFSATSFQHLFLAHGILLVDVERIPIHGGSLRAFFQRSDGPCSLAAGGQPRVRRLLEEESEARVDRIEFFQGFGQQVAELREQLLRLLRGLKQEGKHIAIYGASAKSTTLLNYFGIGRETVDYVVDRNPTKQKKFTPGTHLPIYSPERLLETRPDYVLLLSWNLESEVLGQQSLYRQQGGRFIVPIPTLRIM